MAITRYYSTLMKTFLIKLHWFLGTQLGLDPRNFFNAFRGLPRYIVSLYFFKKNYAGKLTLLPCLHDWYSEAGTIQNEYFVQDLFVARMIYMANPEKHVDIGSRLDGFVAHVASFREVEVFDIRPLTAKISGITFQQSDLMSPDFGYLEYCDSLSCLHAIEHFGLGRYGDPINPLGYERGLTNMALLLKPGGSLYLATPIGVERVEFNANRIFDPLTIKSCAEKNGLELSKLFTISQNGVAIEVDDNSDSLSSLSLEDYNLGIFVFIKKI